MKFSDIERDRWDDLKPYLDTALIPLSGLTGEEQPWEATGALERLRDAMDPLEQLYTGRIVTYPAIHYSQSDEELESLVNEVCRRLRKSGFQHCVVVAASKRLSAFRPKEASIVITPLDGDESESEGEYRRRVRAAVEGEWFGGKK